MKLRIPSMFIPCRARLLTAMYVAAFAELGVLTRLYLDKLFQVRAVTWSRRACA